MIANGEITKSGILSPMQHIPYAGFLNALSHRGIVVEEEETDLN